MAKDKFESYMIYKYTCTCGKIFTARNDAKCADKIMEHMNDCPNWRTNDDSETIRKFYFWGDIL